MGFQGSFSGNDYSRGNYGADQGSRQEYGGRSGDYGQQGRSDRGLWARASDEVSSWLSRELGVPVVEGIGAPIRVAAAMASLGLQHSRRRWPKSPNAK